MWPLVEMSLTDSGLQGLEQQEARGLRKGWMGRVSRVRAGKARMGRTGPGEELTLYPSGLRNWWCLRETDRQRPGEEAEAAHFNEPQVTLVRGG